MHVYFAIAGGTKDEAKNKLYQLIDCGSIDYFDEDTMERYTGKEIKKMTDIFYVIILTAEDPIYILPTYNFTKLERSIADDSEVWKVDVHM